MMRSVQRQSLVSSVQVKVLASNASVTTYLASTAYTALRISAFFNDLYNPSKYCTKAGDMVPLFSENACTEDQILTDEKRNILINSLVPQAIKLHADRLMVQSTGRVVIVPSTTNPSCLNYDIPAAHYTTGVDADFVLYVSAGPTNGNIVAWASPCATNSAGRPVYGIANFSPYYIGDWRYAVRIMTHEMAHALGFTAFTFTPQSVSNLRGKSKAFVLNTPSVVAKAREQFGCATQEFMELEDDSNSHWKMRSAQDELMCGSPYASYYSALTLAAFEDLGFYKVNYDMAEKMGYGYKVGCGLTTNKCIINGVSQIPSMFCTDTRDLTLATQRCMTDHLSLGGCAVSTDCSAVPSYEQYFPGNTVCGREHWMDYCPTYAQLDRAACDTISSFQYPGSYGTSTSRCLNAVGTVWTSSNQEVGALCAAVQCNGSPSYSIRLSESDPWTPCPEGATVNIGSQSTMSSGQVTCPYYFEMCWDYVGSTTTPTTTPTTTNPITTSKPTTAPPATAPPTSAAPTTANPHTRTSTTRNPRCNIIGNKDPTCNSASGHTIIVLPLFIFAFLLATCFSV